MDKGSRAAVARLAIPKGAFPVAANLAWSPDAGSLVFEYSPDVPDPVPALYLVHVDGSGLVKLADAAHTPAISPDGRCLAYLSQGQVRLLDLHNPSFPSLLVADLPAGRGPKHW